MWEHHNAQDNESGPRAKNVLVQQCLHAYIPTAQRKQYGNKTKDEFSITDIHEIVSWISLPLQGDLVDNDVSRGAESKSYSWILKCGLTRRVSRSPALNPSLHRNCPSNCPSKDMSQIQVCNQPKQEDVLAALHNRAASSRPELRPA